jgi:hypothetical protein
LRLEVLISDTGYQLLFFWWRRLIFLRRSGIPKSITPRGGGVEKACSLVKPEAPVFQPDAA